MQRALAAAEQTWNATEVCDQDAGVREDAVSTVVEGFVSVLASRPGRHDDLIRALRKWVRLLDGLDVTSLADVRRECVEMFVQSGAPVDERVVSLSTVSKREALRRLYGYAVAVGCVDPAVADRLLTPAPQPVPSQMQQEPALLAPAVAEDHSQTQAPSDRTGAEPAPEVGSATVPATGIGARDERTVSAIVARYLRCMPTDRGNATSTAKNYGAVLWRLDHFLRLRQIHGIDEVAREHISDFLRAEAQRVVRGKRVAKSTVAHSKDVVRAFAAWCFEMEVVPRHLAAHLHTKRKERTPEMRRNALLAPQFEACVAVADPLARLLVEFLGLTGSRISAALGVRVRDWNPYLGFVVVEPKGDAPVPLPVCARLGRHLQAWIETAQLGPDDYVFTSRQRSAGAPKAISRKTAWEIVGRLTEPANKYIAAQRASKAPGWEMCYDIPGTVSPHRLRHTFAECMDAAGVTMQDLAEALGHRGLSTAQEWYLRHADAVRRVRCRLDEQFPDTADAATRGAA